MINQENIKQAEYYIEKGKERLKNSEYNYALQIFKKVLTLDPNNKEAFFEIGKIYYLLKQYDQSAQSLIRAKEKDSLKEHVAFLLARTFAALGNYAEAIEQLNELKKIGSCVYDIESEFSSIYRQRYERINDVFISTAKIYNAIDTYKKRLKNNFSDETAIAHLIQIYNFKGDYESAKEAARLALKHIPENNIFLRNKVLNEYEIADGKTILSSKVRSLSITLSRRCNLSCIMCLPPDHPWELPEKTLKEIYALFPYLEKILWQGGEVFVLDYFEELLSEGFRYPNIRQSIVTNAQLIEERIAERLLKNSVGITISIDGTTKETYEYIRRGASFEKLIRNLKLIGQLRKQFNSGSILNLNVAIMKSNYKQIESFIDFAKEYGFDFLCLMPIEILVKKNINTAEDIFVNNKDIGALNFLSKASRNIQEKAKSYGIRLENRLSLVCDEINNEKNGSIIDDRHQKKIQDRRKLLCHLPWQQLLIDYDGIIRPDCQCDLVKNTCSLFEYSSLEEIWNSKVMQGYRRAILDHDYLNICSKICMKGMIPETHLKIP